ncbi:MAG: ASKHA domain-containing protein [bacterium]
MPTITFLPFDKTAETDGSETILEVARRLGLPLESACGGRKACGKCKVVIERCAEPLPAPSERELKALGSLIGVGYRLACESAVGRGEIVVRIPEEAVCRTPVVLTSGAGGGTGPRVKPCVRACTVDVPEPVLRSAKGDLERLSLALRESHRMNGFDADPLVLRKLPGLLRTDAGTLTAVVRGGREVIDLRAGRQARLLGIAFDIGTTTVVGYLSDLTSGRVLSVRSALNPQVSFGADVIRRVSLCQEQEDGLEKLRSGIVGCLNGLLAEACEEAKAAPSDVVDATAVGNTVMHHLLMGLDPRYLAMAPYPPVLQGAQDVKARDLGLALAPSAYVHLLPLKAGFVGSDTIAGVLSAGLHRSGTPTLYLDLGTNGEIVMGNRDRLICCSTAAGPAFEGGHIEFGMRAAPGAIEGVRIARDSLEVSLRTIGGLPPVGICGSGILAAVAEMIRTGIVLPRGNFDESARSPRVRRGERGWELVLAWASETGIGRDIVVTRKDVSEMQLAKSAVHAGACLLQETFASPFRRVLLAGACGNYMDPRDALTIGLLPQNPGARILGVGNAAGHGSCLALVDRRKRTEAVRVAGWMEYQELAGNRRFEEIFLSGMFFPPPGESS